MPRVAGIREPHASGLRSALAFLWSTDRDTSRWAEVAIVRVARSSGRTKWSSPRVVGASGQRFSDSNPGTPSAASS